MILALALAAAGVTGAAVMTDVIVCWLGRRTVFISPEDKDRLGL